MRYVKPTILGTALAILGSITIGAVANAGSQSQDSKPPVHVRLPAGWVATEASDSHVVQEAENRDALAMFELVAIPTSDFADDVTLLAWAKLVKAEGQKNNPMANRVESELKQDFVGNVPTVEYDVTGELKGLKLHFRMIMLRCNNHYCKLICWTIPSQWAANQSKFTELVRNLE